MAFLLASSSSFAVSAVLVLVLLYARPAHAFGAGNIASVSQIEGSNFRHGDIEDTLLTLITAYAYGKGKKFSKLDVKRVYFGNWLRDYSQAIDVGTTKHVSAEAIRILLWVLGFLTFGYGTGEFEVTSERLGCYRPEEHIDNPKDYADNEDARKYDRRLRAPVDEETELSVDERTGLKNYIASEDLGITTSAGLVRNLFGRAIDLGRSYKRTGDKKEFYEALRLLGTGLHCCEDYSAHSNYVELALVELGERGVFPHVGRETQIRVRGAQHPVWPIVTGTFGGVDFLHSVLGELDDKTTQSEIQELEGVMEQSQGQNNSILKKLLGSLPSGILGGGDQAGKVDELQDSADAAQMGNLNVSPRQPEAWAQQLSQISKQLYPIFEFHDNLMMNISEAIEKIPVLPDLIEQIQEQVNVFVFSLLAPFVIPVITQVKEELATGSSEVIQSSRDKQLVVFHNDSSSDPTHSMLSKDHFSNILNEPAGKVSCAVLKWVVPQLIQAMDSDEVNIARTLNRIIGGVFHHPALRRYGEDGASDGRHVMFGQVEQWWGEKSEHERDDLRQKLSRQGVQSGENHKEGVQDSGHGCCKPLFTQKQNNAPAAAAHAAVMDAFGDALGGGQPQHSNYGNQHQSSGVEGQASSFISEAVGGGPLGSILGGLVGGVGGSLLGGAFEAGGKTETYQEQGYNPSGSYTSGVMQTGQLPPNAYGTQHTAQAEYTNTQYPGGGHKTEYSRYDQEGGQGYGYRQSSETRRTDDGGFEQRSERRYDLPGGRWEDDVQEQGVSAAGEHYQSEERHHGRRHDNDDSDEQRERRHHNKHRNDYDSHSGGGGYPGQEYHRQHERQDYERPSDGQAYEQEPRRPGFGGGFGGGFGREEFGGGRQEFDGTRQEYGGGSAEFGGGEEFGERQQHGRHHGHHHGRHQSEEEDIPGDFPGEREERRRFEEGDGYGRGW